MSFGKDNENLNRVAPYGGNLSQRARHHSKAREESRRSGGGGAPYWKNTFKVPQDHARFGRLIAGNYVQQVSYDNKTVVEMPFEYFMFKEHFHGTTKRGGICSAGPLFSNRQLRNPCSGCDKFWEEVAKNKARPKNERQKKSMSARDMFAFTWWDYGLWYNAPRIDRDGKTVTNDQGQPYLEWVMGQENDPRYQGCEWKYGHLLAWPMGETYKDTLLQANDYIMQDCANCGQRNSIQFVSKACGQCGTVVYDANTSLTPEQREQIDTSIHACQACGHSGFLSEMINCSSCGNGKRASIFDVDLQITATGSKGQQTHLNILNRSEPRPIQIQDPEVLKTVGPLDLAKKFAPTTLAEQKELWDLEPSGPQQPQAAAQPMAPPFMGPMGHVPAQVAQSVMAGQHAAPYPSPPAQGQGGAVPMQPSGMGVPSQGGPALVPPPMTAAPGVGAPTAPQQPAPPQPPPMAMPGAQPAPGIPQPAPGFAPPQQPQTPQQPAPPPMAPAAAPALPGAPGIPAIPYGGQGNSQ